MNQILSVTGLIKMGETTLINGSARRVSVLSIANPIIERAHGDVAVVQSVSPTNDIPEIAVLLPQEASLG